MTGALVDQREADALWEARFWTRSYRPGVPERIDRELAQAGSMAELFERDAARFADREGFVSMGTGRTYGQMRDDARAFAAWLQHIGVAKGDRVALMMPNCLQYPVALFGTLLAGAIVVNVNPLYTARELEHQLNDSGATVMVVMDLFAETFAAARQDTAVRQVIVTSMGDMLGPIKGRAIDLLMRKRRARLSGKDVVPWKSAMRIGRSHRFSPVAVAQDDLAFLQYTGGTTGVAKGAMLTHRNVVANVLQGRAWALSGLDEDDPPTNVTLLPLYHVFSLTANLLMFSGVGGRNVMIANPRDTGRVAWILRHEKISGLSGVNTLFASLLDDPKFSRRDFSGMQLSIAGGMATHADIARRWEAMTGAPLVEGYGLTECSPVVCIRPIDFSAPEVMAHNGSVGLPVSSTEVRMRREDGGWCDIGEPGELCVRGPQVMLGYWGKPDETAAVLSDDGWLATGDVGVMARDGEVRLVDRLKDMILVSGFNVYPSEIEGVILDHPDICEAAVVGEPDPVKGERIVAVVYSETPDLTAEALRTWCRARLTGYKVPSRFELRDAPLPKSGVGKILRRELL